MKSKFEEARRDFQQSTQAPKPWETAIVNRRKVVVRSLLGAAIELRRKGDETLATAVERYAKELPRPETERHQIKQAIVANIEKQRKIQEPSQKRGASRDDDQER